MGHSIPQVSLALALLSALAVGCSSPPAPEGRLEVSPASIDFGAVFTGTSITRKVGVRNVGDGPLTLTALTASNPEVTDFQVSFQKAVLQPQQAVELEATFTPAASGTSAVEATFAVHAEGTHPGEDTATFTLRGQPAVGDCEGIGNLDFGPVALGDTGRASFTLRNPTTQPLTYLVGAFSGAAKDLAAFSLAADANGGTLTVDPGKSLDVTVEFHPTDLRSFSASMSVQLGEGCPEQHVTLTGEGVNTVLSWTPFSLDCGYVTPSSQVTRDIVFSNLSHTPVHLSHVRTTNTSEFHVVAEDGADPSVFEVPATGSANLKVACTPPLPGPRAGQLSFDTGLQSQPSGNIALKVYGGGPDIDVPATLDFGKVAWFASTTGQAMITRRLLVKNVGTLSAVKDPLANLHLGTQDDSGGWAQPFVEITPLNDGTTAEEFQVTLPPSYDPDLGIEATVGKNELALEVTVAPKSLGEKQAQLTIHSNDSDEPTVTVLLSANAVALPSCRYSVSATTLDFGTVTPPRYTDLQFRITNTGTAPTDTCLISGVDLFDSASGVFSLPGGTVDQAELGAGKSLTIYVRAWPQGPRGTGDTPLHGELRFFASSDSQPQTSVVPQAILGRACLEIAPRDFDFGDVQSGCASATRTFSIYNTCDTDATLTGISLQAAAGLTAGEPGCTQGAGCPEFELVQTPSIPAGGLTLPPRNAPVTFQVKYRPVDTGIDLGAVAVSESQGLAAHTSLGVLRASAGTQANRTETLSLPSKPRADVLLVIDTSGCMDDDQLSMANSSAAFLQYAQSAQVDFHLASTTTDMESTGEHGRFVSVPLTHEKILVPGTPNLQDKLGSLINLGSNGSGLEMEAEPAITALSDPLIVADNAGFLREDASLGIVALTDEYDQSPGGLAYYLDRLWNVKGRGAANLFTFSAIAGFSSSCKQVTGGGDVGDKLAFYASRTGGATLDLCTVAPWPLQEMGKAAFGFRTRYFLGEQPDLGSGSVELRINSVLTPSRSSTGATIWTYDAVANSVNFEPTSAPSPGDTLEFSYPVACYQ